MTAFIQGQPHDRNALIVYGSETGNSQEAAEQVGRIAGRLRFVTQVLEMNRVELNDLLASAVVIFTISTTGQGDFPENARLFWKSLLRKRLPATCLSHVRFTTFGFGDSSYAQFNWPVRKLHKRLLQLGAQEIFPRGEADDQHSEGADGTFLPWSLDLKSQLLEKFPLPEGLLPIPDSELLPPKWTLELATISEEVLKSEGDSGLNCPSTLNGFAAMDGPITHNFCIRDRPSEPNEVEDTGSNLPPDDLLPIPNSYMAAVQENVSLTPADHWQDVRHVDLLINEKLDYVPGDCISIYPKNFPEDVNSLIKLMDWTADADKPLTFICPPGSYLDPTFIPALQHLHTTDPPTLRSLLLHNLDITAIPRRFFFEALARYTSDPLHRSRLLEFTNPAYTDEFYDYTTRPRRSILEVLHDFPSVRLPWRWATTIFPALRPRQFSIASGGRLKRPESDSDVAAANDTTTTTTTAPTTTTIHICVALVKYRTVLKKIRQGLCSRYLATLPPGTAIRITFHRSGAFATANASLHRPLLMIAPGTGVAPMRSLIWERAAARQQLRARALLTTTSSTSPPTTATSSSSGTTGTTAGEAVLIFGNRARTADFLYGEDWLRKELDVKVLTAWSRDAASAAGKAAAAARKDGEEEGGGGENQLNQKNQKRGEYVQEVVRREADLVWRLLVKEKGSVFVCGRKGSMPMGVRAALVDALERGGRDGGSGSGSGERRGGEQPGRGEQVAEIGVGEEEVRRLEREGRYVQETW